MWYLHAHIRNVCTLHQLTLCWPELAPGCGTCQAPPPCCEWSFHPLRDWAHVGVVLCELPTASSHFGSTGVLWVLTGTHPCGPPSRMMEVTRAPALCGLWSWSAVVKWSCGVIERCGNMSVSQHPSTGYHDWTIWLSV